MPCTYTARWRYLPPLNSVQFTITSRKPERWTGIGFGESPTMRNSDAVFGWVTGEGRFSILDAFMPSYVAPVLDSTQVWLEFVWAGAGPAEIGPILPNTRFCFLEFEEWEWDVCWWAGDDFLYPPHPDVGSKGREPWQVSILHFPSRRRAIWWSVQENWETRLTPTNIRRARLYPHHLSPSETEEAGWGPVSLWHQARWRVWE